MRVLDSLVFCILVLIVSSTTSPNIRLISKDGSSGNSGRLEVYYAGSWGTVCNTGWSSADTIVVCRQLRFYGGVTNLLPLPGRGRIWMSQVQCAGKETDLLDCPHHGWGEFTCSHSNDVNIHCSIKGKFKLLV